MKDLIEKVWQIAKQNPRGFTIMIPSCESVTSGWVIGHIETQNSFGKEGLEKVIEHSMKTTKIVGGWKGYNGKFYFDTVIQSFDPNEALKLKQEHEQLAIYHIDSGRIL